MIDEHDAATTGDARKRGRSTASRVRRIGLVLLVGLVVATTAVGPTKLAAAVGLRSSPAMSPGFLPEPTPAEVRAPSLRLYSLRTITENAQIPLAGGGQSPSDTILLQFAKIELDDLTIDQARSQSSLGQGSQAIAPFNLNIANPGSGADAAVIGGAGENVDLYGVLHSLDFCLSIANLTSLAQGLPVVGGLLGTVLGLIGKLVPVPIQGGANSPCFPLASLLPIIGALLKAGIPLPSPIPANNLDIDVYALHVTAPSGSTSLELPTGELTVTER
ncbi:MAG: hypothetical protein ACR2LX_13440 [Jatrophihabitans sp.]